MQRETGKRQRGITYNKGRCSYVVLKFSASQVQTETCQSKFDPPQQHSARCYPVCLSTLTRSLACLWLTLLSEWVTILSFTVAVGNKALYKIEINQIMLKSPVCGCVTNLGCPYNLSQMMTEESNKGAYSHHHCHSESLEAVRDQAAQTAMRRVHV